MPKEGHGNEKIVNLDLARQKEDDRPNSSLRTSRLLSNFLGKKFTPPENFRQLSLEESIEFAKEIIKHFSEGETLLDVYTEEIYPHSMYPDAAKARHDAAKELPKHLNENRQAANLQRPQDAVDMLSHIKADPNVFLSVFTLAIAESLVRRFPSTP